MSRTVQFRCVQIDAVPLKSTQCTAQALTGQPVLQICDRLICWNWIRAFIMSMSKGKRFVQEYVILEDRED